MGTYDCSLAMMKLTLSATIFTGLLLAPTVWADEPWGSSELSNKEQGLEICLKNVGTQIERLNRERIQKDVVAMESRITGIINCLRDVVEFIHNNGMLIKMIMKQMHPALQERYEIFSKIALRVKQLQPKPCAEKSAADLRRELPLRVKHFLSTRAATQAMEIFRHPVYSQP